MKPIRSLDDTLFKFKLIQKYFINYKGKLNVVTHTRVFRVVVIVDDSCGQEGSI